MVDELRHKETVDPRQLCDTDWTGIYTHIFNSQAKGDIPYAKNATQLIRLGIGSTNDLLVVIGGVPVWSATLAGLTLTSPTINGATIGGNIAGGGYEITALDRQNYNETNLLENGDFEVGDPPDGWTLIGGGATVSRSSTQAKIGTYSALLTRNGPDCHIYQAYSGYAAYAGRTVTLGCWAYATEDSSVSIGLGDGSGSSSADTHTGVAGWEWLTASLTVDASPTYLRSYLEVFDGDTSAYFDGAILVEGDSCPAFSPKPIGTYDAITLRQALNANSQNITNVGTITAATAQWWHEYILPAAAFSTGASGATQVSPDANTLGGWVLDRDDTAEIIFATSHIEDDWDGASDPTCEVYFEVNVDNTGGADADTVDLKMIYRYKGEGEAAIKTQTVEVPTTVGKSARYKQFKVVFPLNWDLASNVLEVADVISLGLSLETDTSEVDNVIINFAEFRYHTNKPAPEV